MRNRKGIVYVLVVLAVLALVATVALAARRRRTAIRRRACCDVRRLPSPGATAQMGLLQVLKGIRLGTSSLGQFRMIWLANGIGVLAWCWPLRRRHTVARCASSGDHSGVAASGEFEALKRTGAVSGNSQISSTSS